MSSTTCMQSLALLTLVVGSQTALAESWQGVGEMPLDYRAYIRDFNSGDDHGLVEKYFTTDTQMISGSGVREGHKVVMWDKDHIFAEIDMDFVASKARPDFTFGALQAGDILTVKFFAEYTVVNGKIKTLKTMTWKAETGVTKAPKLGNQAGQRAAFIAYTRAFSGGLPDKYSAFYTDDVSLQLSSVGNLRGKKAIVDYYTKMFRTVRENLEINQIVFDENGIVGDFVSVFTAVEDAPDFVVAPLKKGESIRVPVFVFYTLKDGLISQIRVARSGTPMR